MLIYPAIDLLEGRCVRLQQGRFDSATVFGTNPFAMLARFVRHGGTWAHIVDLDGAKASAPRQHETIAQLAASFPIHIQAGGGLRHRKDVHALLEGGVARAVIGSAAVTRSEDVRQWLAEFGPERVCLAFDVKQQRGRWRVAIKGWQDFSDISLEEALEQFPAGCIRHVLITDVARDGMMGGPNEALTRHVRSLRPDLEVQASGGIATLNDLAQLKAAGAAGAIVGRALYEDRITLAEALHAG